MPVDEAPNDDDVRETYNFPPGAYGLVYRANVPDGGVQEENEPVEGKATDKTKKDDKSPKTYNFELKAMKWGLIPFWTKRSPDYGSMMRTINCRDDSLIENRGMWTTMKQRKRCIVIAQGFYEWLKKGPGGKDKIPYFVKKKDGSLMCFAGLWDCVKYEDTDEKLYTYTIITTDSNKQLGFLHDRMPVILEPGSEGMNLWLDPTQNKWSKELQSLLKPYAGELDCYQVSKEVGKVGNNSPDFIVPIDSKENKNNIANFFGNAKKKEEEVETEHDLTEDRGTKDHDSTENHAPMPIPDVDSQNNKRKFSDTEADQKKKSQRLTSPARTTPVKQSTGRRTRSAVSNEGLALKKSPQNVAADGTPRITNFFN